jgi:hypothetical protein
MYVFLDTEFIPPDGPEAARLLSLGMCSLDGREFYCELTQPGLPKTLDPFVVEHVVAQLRAGVGVVGDGEQVAQDAVAWLNSLGERALDVCYDYHVDFDLLEALTRLSSQPLETELRATHVGYLLGEPSLEAAADECFASLGCDRGLRRHPALADALALRARFIAAHGR